MSQSTRIALFPLKVVLYPGQPLPLHIFEPRYRLMVEECVRLGTPFGVVFSREESFASVGCTARIRKLLQEYEDGRKDILAIGEARFRIVEVYDDLPYLTADVLLLRDPDEEADRLLRERVITQHMKLLELFGQKLRPTEYDSAPVLSYFLAQNAGLDLEDKQRLLELDGENARIRTLASHFEELIPRVREAEVIRERARTDGYYTGEIEL